LFITNFDFFRHVLNFKIVSVQKNERILTNIFLYGCSGLEEENFRVQWYVDNPPQIIDKEKGPCKYFEEIGSKLIKIGRR